MKCTNRVKIFKKQFSSFFGSGLSKKERKKKNSSSKATFLFTFIHLVNVILEINSLLRSYFYHSIHSIKCIYKIKIKGCK